MQELSFDTMIAIFEEMFGRTLFWTMVAGAGLVTLACLHVLVRDRSVSARRFLWAQISMPLWAVASVAFVLRFTHSGLSALGGPIDLIVLLGVALVGAVGGAVLVYTAQALAGPRPGRAAGAPGK